MINLRDELAARIAASLAETDLADEAIARRAYELAGALVAVRGEPDDERALDPPFDPRWELEPRWSRADEARRAARAAALAGPGLAAARSADWRGAPEPHAAEHALEKSG